VCKDKNHKGIAAHYQMSVWLLINIKFFLFSLF